MQASDASGSNRSGADGSRGGSSLALGLVLGIVLLGGGSLVVGAGGLLWWQYMRTEGTAGGAPGMLAVINERSSAVKVICKGEGDGAVTREAEIPAAGTGNIEVPSRPANCVGSVVGEGEAEVLRWHASDPPAVDEVWTVRIPALTPLQSAALATNPAPEVPAEPVVDPAAAVPTVADVPVDAAYTLAIYSERSDTVKVRCQDVGATEPGALTDVAPSTSLEVPATKLTHCTGTAKDGTLVWMWDFRSPPTDGSTTLHATIAGPAGELLGAGKSTPTARSASKTRPADPAAPATAAEAPAAPSAPAASGGGMSLVKIDVKKAGKLKGASVTIDGEAVPFPGQKAISLGIHTFKAKKDGVIDLACPLVASGKDINVLLDPDRPVCP